IADENSGRHDNLPAMIYTRNLVMALKIKQLGKYLKGLGIIDPLTSFNVGEKHTGIEKFIYESEDSLRNLIVSTNRDYVDRCFTEYGDFFYATRILRADSAGKYHDVDMLRDNELEDMLISSRAI
ncbi:MAG: hypothetical protein ACMG6E_07890, partial [Candidatus Roizmanbacteria bacterium]